GRFVREGEPVHDPGVLVSRAVPRAQARAPQPAVFPNVKTSMRGLSLSVLGMPTAALAEEIQAGNVRALFSLGANPAVAIPDQNRSIAALKELDLFVQMDVKMSASAQLAHYVVPPPMALELPTISLPQEVMGLVYSTWGYAQPFGMYTP